MLAYQRVSRKQSPFCSFAAIASFILKLLSPFPLVASCFFCFLPCRILFSFWLLFLLLPLSGAVVSPAFFPPGLHSIPPDGPWSRICAGVPMGPITVFFLFHQGCTGIGTFLKLQTWASLKNWKEAPLLNFLFLLGWEATSCLALMPMQVDFQVLQQAPPNNRGLTTGL